MAFVVLTQYPVYYNQLLLVNFSKFQWSEDKTVLEIKIALVFLV